MVTKPLATTFAAAVTAGLVASCSGGSGGSSGSSGSDDVPTLRIGTNVDREHPYVRCGWENWSDTLDGTLEVEIFPSNQLGSNVEMVESIMNGNLEMTTVGASEIGQFYPRVSVLEAPYLFDDFEHAQRALDSEEGQELLTSMKDETGLETIGMWYYGTRHFTTNGAPVREPSDLEGRKIRVPDNDVYLAAVDAMGASATPVAFSELYVALSQGVVDGQENPISTIASQGFQEVQEYISLTGHVVSTGLTTVNADWYESLSDEQRSALDEAQEASTESVRECIEQEESDYLEEWTSSGTMEVVDDVDRQAFADLVGPAIVSEFDSSSNWNGLFGTFQSMAD